MQESTEPGNVPPSLDESGSNNPLAGAANADSIRTILTDACCERFDGLGKFDSDAARDLFEGFETGLIAEALAASDLSSLTWLGCILWHFFDGLMFNGLVPAAIPGLVEMRKALSAEFKRKLPTGWPRDLSRALKLECFEFPSDRSRRPRCMKLQCMQDPNGSNIVDVAASRRLFDGFAAPQFSKTLSRSGRFELTVLSWRLDAISEAMGTESCEGLAQVRLAVSDEINRIVEATRRDLPLARNADAVVECIEVVCLPNRRDLNQVDGQAARQLFHALDVEQFRDIFAKSDVPSRQKLAGLLQRLAQSVDPQCEGLDALRQLVTESMKSSE